MLIKCTVFINGDAMGKSIQGAGGAIVLGVVFKSVVARTRIVKEAKNKHPEQHWKCQKNWVAHPPKTWSP